MATCEARQTGVVDGVAMFAGVPMCELDPVRFPAEWAAFRAEYGFAPHEAEQLIWPPVKRREPSALDQYSPISGYTFGGFRMQDVIDAGPGSRLWQRFEAAHGKSPDKAGPGFVPRFWPGASVLGEPTDEQRGELRQLAARLHANRVQREAEVRAAVMAEFRPQIEAEVSRRLEA